MELYFILHCYLRKIQGKSIFLNTQWRDQNSRISWCADYGVDNGKRKNLWLNDLFVIGLDLENQQMFLWFQSRAMWTNLWITLDANFPKVLKNIQENCLIKYNLFISVQFTRPNLLPVTSKATIQKYLQLPATRGSHNLPIFLHSPWY